MRPLVALAAVLALMPASIHAQLATKDWMDSPFTGQGNPPPGVVTKIYMSIYLDRILSIDETKYTYQANFYFVLSWKDPRALADVANATAAAREPGAAECRRPCNGQKAPTASSRCCSTLYLPTILFRNVEEFLQGRTQAYTIRAEPDGTVLWRSEVRGSFYFTASFVAFPWDVQSLDLAMVLQNNATTGATATVVPSASGVGLFSFGSGDDVSGWRITNITVAVSERPWSSQYNDPESRNLRTRSAPGDYAPLVPAERGERAYGWDLSVVQIRAGIIVKRLSLYYSLTSIVPIVICVALALLTHVLDPDQVETRLQVIVTLVLSLTALQIVFEGELPKSSYILPTGQMVQASYTCMLVSAIMSIAVYNIHSWPDVRSYWAGMAAARAARADLRAARRRAAGDKRAPSFARSATRMLAALTQGGRQRFAPAPGGRFARNVPHHAPCSDDECDVVECGDGSGASAAGTRRVTARAAAALSAEAERGWYNWLATLIDAVTLVVLALLYTVVVVGIFIRARMMASNALL